KKVVVLGAVEFRTKPSDGINNLAPDDGEMANVVAGEKIIRRPIGFENRRLEALLCQLVFIGIDQIGVPMVLEPFDVFEKRIGFENVVVVEKTDPFPFRELNSVI